MAGRRQDQLKSLLLDNVKKTGKELGRGAYGVVVEVRVGGLVCAGKTLHEAIVQSETLVKFAEECLCHSQLRHPNIVQLMGVHFSQHSRLPMLVMEYLPLSLTHCLETHQDLPLQIKYSILLDISKGLNYLHCKTPPIVHRYLTANNILLTSNFIAKITDLGVSRMADTFKQQEFTKAPGNWSVMPPEAHKDNPSYDHKLDVFSYGCLILHVFTHQWPKPTDQYVPSTGWFRWTSFDLVSEWDRRSKYTKQLQNNPLYHFTRQCLDNKPQNRPAMNEAIQRIDGALSEITPSKNKLEMMKEISDLQQLVQSKESEVVCLQDRIQKSKQGTKHTHEDKREPAVDKTSLLTNSKQKEINEHIKLIQLQTQSQEYQKQVRIAREVTRLKESESLELQQQLDHLQRQLTKAEMLLHKANITVKSLIDENVQLKADVTSLNKVLENALKSKHDVINILESELQTAPLYQDQKDIIQPLLVQQLRKGDSWYLVDQRWLTQWKINAGFDSWDQWKSGIEIGDPGPLDNLNLFKDIKPNTLRDDLIEWFDYVLLPKPVWDLLVSWYGLSVGSQPICRYVVEHGTYVKHLKVDVYLLELKVSLYPHVNDVKYVHFSRATTIGTVIQKIRELFSIPVTDGCRLWDHYMINSYEVHINLDQTLHDAGIYGGLMLMLEVRNPDGSWPKKVELKLCIHPNTNNIILWSFDIFDTVETVIEKGKELFNLSNTIECRLWKCYMTNSYDLLTNLTQTLPNVGIYNRQILMLEMRNFDSSWPKENNTSLENHN